jgi:hypothetical protein
MRRTTTTFAALLGLVAAAMMVAAGSASASFHEMKIRSIFRGPSPMGAFVELQMYAAGQNFVGGHALKIYNHDASSSTTFSFPMNVANGQNQSRILIGDMTAPGSPDFTATGLGTALNTAAGAGAACWETVDCVAWGNFTGAATLPSPPGTPIAGGLNTTMVSLRSITANCSTALDAADDTDNSSADFGFAVGYSPRNNSLVPTETVCPPGNPISPTNPAGNTRKRKCKKKQKRSAEIAKKKSCKKKRH